MRDCIFRFRRRCIVGSKGAFLKSSCIRVSRCIMINSSSSSSSVFIECHRPQCPKPLALTSLPSSQSKRSQVPSRPTIPVLLLSATVFINNPTLAGVIITPLPRQMKHAPRCGARHRARPCCRVLSRAYCPLERKRWLTGRLRLLRGLWRRECKLLGAVILETMAMIMGVGVWGFSGWCCRCGNGDAQNDDSRMVILVADMLHGLMI